MTRACRGERPRDHRALFGGSGGEAGPQPRAPRVDAKLSTGLGVDEPERAGIRKLLLGPIANLDRNELVTARELEQRTMPVERAAKVTDHDNDRALPREGTRASERFSEGVAPIRSAPASPVSPRRAPSSPIRARRPCRGGQRAGSGRRT